MPSDLPTVKSCAAESPATGARCQGWTTNGRHAGGEHWSRHRGDRWPLDTLTFGGEA